jgi:hypothetical protein
MRFIMLYALVMNDQYFLYFIFVIFIIRSYYSSFISEFSDYKNHLYFISIAHASLKVLHVFTSNYFSMFLKFFTMQLIHYFISFFLSNEFFIISILSFIYLLSICILHIILSTILDWVINML